MMPIVCPDVMVCAGILPLTDWSTEDFQPSFGFVSMIFALVIFFS